MAIPEGHSAFNESNPVARRTTPNTAVDIIGEIHGLANKNAVSSAKDNGVNEYKNGSHREANDTPKASRNAMSLFAKDAHKRASRVLGYALTLGGYEAWNNTALVWTAHLNPQERAGLAFAALKSLDEQTAYNVADLVLFGTHKGRP